MCDDWAGAGVRSDPFEELLKALLISRGTREPQKRFVASRVDNIRVVRVYWVHSCVYFLCAHTGALGRLSNKIKMHIEGVFTPYR